MRVHRSTETYVPRLPRLTTPKEEIATKPARSITGRSQQPSNEKSIRTRLLSNKMNPNETSLKYLQQLQDDRIDRIFQDLQEWGNRPILFSYDPRGTCLYAIEETKRAYCRRFVEFSLAARTLLENQQYNAACIVARAQIETVAMGAFFVHEISRLLHAGAIENFNTKIKRFLMGSSSMSATNKPIHVADALRHLQELDEAYITKLWNRHPIMKKEVSKILETESDSTTADNVISTVSVTKNYDFLCDFAHPNGPSTFFFLGQPENETIAHDKLRGRLASLTNSATWQGHHMLQALNAADSQSDDYFATFAS